MDSCHIDSQNTQSGDVNAGGGLPTDTASALYFETLSTADHERIIGSVIGGKVVFPNEQKNSSIGLYGNLEALSGYTHDSSESSIPTGGTQLKVNGVVGRKGNYGATAGKHALRQQARRRRRNTSIAAGNSPPITRVTMKSGAPSAACSPSGISPTRTSSQSGSTSVIGSQSQHSPLSSQKFLKSHSSNMLNQMCSYQLLENSIGVRNTCESLPADNLARIIISKINCDVNIGKSLENSVNYPISQLNYLDSSSRNLLQGRDSVITTLSSLGSRSSLLQPSVPMVRSSSRLAGSSTGHSSGSQTLTSSCSIQNQQAVIGTTNSFQNNRNLRVCPPQSSPSTRDSSSPSMTTMQCYLSSIPGFKPRKRSQRKLSTAAQLAQTKEGNIDLETPDSILVNVNLKSLINVDTFSSLPPTYQHRLAQLLPRVDQIVAPDNSLKVISTGFHNEFLARACVSWKDRLSEGEFTHDNQVKLRGEAEKERSKLDPWKVAHFEPVWGMKQSIGEDGEVDSCSSLLVSVGDENDSSLSSSSTGIHRPSSPLFTNVHIKKLTKVIQFIANKEQRRKERREARRSLRAKERMEQFSKAVGENTDSFLQETDNRLTESSVGSFNLTNPLSNECIVNTSPLEDSFSIKEERVPIFDELPGNMTNQKEIISEDPSPNVNSQKRSYPEDFLPSTMNLKRKMSPVEFEYSPKKVCSPEAVRKLSETKSEEDKQSHIIETKIITEIKSETDACINKIVQLLSPNKCMINASPATSSNQLAVPVNCSLQPCISPVTSFVTITSKSPVIVPDSSLFSSTSSSSPSIISVTSTPPKPTLESCYPSTMSSSVVHSNPSLSSKIGTSTSSYISKLNSLGVNVCAGSSSALVGQSVPTSKSPTKKNIKGQIITQGSPVTLRISKMRTHGGVNLQRSYEIVQGVIANSPNREQLQAQLKPHPVLLAEPKSLSAISISSSSAKSTTIETRSLEKEPSMESSLSITHLPQQQQSPFITPKVVPPSSVQSQTLVLKALSTSTGQFAHPFPQGTQSISQFLPTGQRIFRSVALPLTAFSSSGSTMMIRPGLSTQIGVSSSESNLSNNITSITQTFIKEASKTPVSTSGPITILRPAAGGKPVFLRTLSVSNVHLVRVSDILNGRTDGDAQHPPRASSAPPTRNTIVTIPSVIPRPNSVGPRNLIPTSPAHHNFIPSSPSPARHFLSEGDPSSGVNNTNSNNLHVPLEIQEYKNNNNNYNNNNNNSIVMETRAGANHEISCTEEEIVHNDLNSYKHSSFSQVHSGTTLNSTVKEEWSPPSILGLESTHSNEIEIKREADEEIRGVKGYSCQNKGPNSIQSSSLEVSDSFTDNMDDCIPDNNSTDLSFSFKVNNETSCSIIEPPTVDVDESPGNGEENTSADTCTLEDVLEPNNLKESPCSNAQEMREEDSLQSENSLLETVQKEDIDSVPYPVQQQGVIVKHHSQQHHEDVQIQSLEDYQHQNVVSSKIVQQQQQQQQCFHQQNPYQHLVQQQNNSMQQQMLHKQTYYIQQQQHSGVAAQQGVIHPQTQQGIIHPQNIYQSIPVGANLVNNIQPIDNQPVAINIHTFTNVNNNHVLSAPQSLSMNANMSIGGDMTSAPPEINVMTQMVGGGMRKSSRVDNSEGESNKSSNISEEGCPCNMRAMIACLKCGAFCHHDCISSSRLCVTCLIR